MAERLIDIGTTESLRFRIEWSHPAEGKTAAEETRGQALLWGAGNLNPHTIGFEAISVVVRMDADAPRTTLEALVRHATLWSPVANTLHNPVHLDVTLESALVRAA